MVNETGNPALCVFLIKQNIPALNPFIKLLEQAGFEVRSFMLAEDAISELDKNAPPLIIITDLIVPDIDGLRLSQLMRSEEYLPYNHVPVVITSYSSTSIDTVHSHLNLGSSLYLTSQSDPQLLYEMVRRLIEHPEHFQQQVLIVEDSRATALIVKKTLESSGYKTHTVTTARSAVDAFRKCTYDFAILDFHLPDKNGDELFQELSAVQPECIYLMMTTNPNPALAAGLMRLGVSGYLHKPFEPDHLLELCARSARRKAIIHTEKQLIQRTQQLQENQQRYEAMLSALPDLIFRIDSNMCFIDFHAGQPETLLVTPEEFLGKTISEVLSPELAEILETTTRKVLQSGELETHRYAADLQDGKHFYENRMVPCGKDEALAIIRDITETIEHQEALHLQSLVLDQIQDRVTITDLEGVITYVNHAETLMLHREKEELIGKTIAIYGEDPDRGPTQDEILTSARRDGFWRGEMINYSADGRELIMDSRIQVVHDQSGTPVAICGISSDISASKQAQRALEESELRFRSMARNVPGVLFQFTALPDGTLKVEYSSSQITELLGISIEDGLDHVLADFTDSSHPDDRERLVRSIDDSVEKKEPWQYEGRFTGNSGQPLWLQGAANLRPQEGRLIFEGILLDITERKQAGLALQQSELKFHTLVDQAVEMLFLHDVEGNLIDVNQKAILTTGYSREELLAMEVFALDPDAGGRDDAASIWRALKPGDPALTFEARHQRKDGSMYPAEVTVSKVVLSEKEYIFALARDITQRKYSEEALRRSEQKYRSLTNTTIDWVFQTDSEARYTYVSPNVAAIMGYEVDEILGKTPFDFVVPEESQRMRSMYQRTAGKKARLTAVEDTFLHKNGRQVHFETNAVPLLDDHGQLNGYFGTCRNITDRKHAEEALLQREEELRQAQHMAHVGSWQFDLERGMVVASEEARRIYGLDSTEWTIKDVQTIPLPEHRKVLDEALTALIEKGRPYDIQFQIRRPADGEIRHIHSLAEYDELQHRVIGTIQDITGQVQAQEALRQSEDLLRTIANNFPHSYLSVIEKDLTVGFTSGQEFQKLGLNPEQYEGLTLEEVFGEHAITVREHYLETFAGKPVSFELQFNNQDQLYRTVPLKDADEEISRILIVVENITEQKQEARIQENLLLRKQRQAEVLADIVSSNHLAEGNIDELARKTTKAVSRAMNCAQVGVWLFTDHETRIHNVVQYDASRGLHTQRPDLHEDTLPQKFSGLKNSKYLSVDDTLTDLEAVPDEENYLRENRISSVLDAVIRSGEKSLGTISFEHIHTPHHWEEDEIEFALRLADQFALALSNRERRQAQADRERLNQAIEQSGEIVLITDADGSIQYVNPAFETTTGYSITEVLGENPRILKSGEQDDSFYRDMWVNLSLGKKWEGRLVNRKKDGTVYTESASISPVLDTEGKITNFVAVKRDITEQLRLAREKERIEEQYRQTQRVEAIGRLAGGVAHDLNNLLTPILLHTEMLLDEFPIENESRASAREIMNAGTRARDLVNQLLAFSRKQSLEYKSIDLNSIIKDFYSLLRRTIREDITIKTIPGPVECFIEADTGQIEQVLMNLAVNAQDAMLYGGTLTLETSVLDLDDQFISTHPGAEEGKYILLTVSDTGIGIDAATQERIFEPFFSTKGNYGTGLGLATVYGIVKQHGGNIWVCSEVGKGSTFEIYLPAHQPAQLSSEPVRQISSNKLKAQPGTETILLVEDNQQVRKLAFSILKKLGYRMLSAENGKEALALLETLDEPVHLLLTDVVMPSMNGRDLYLSAVQKRPDLKVIYMSGYTDNVIADQGVLDEGIVFIQKPFSIETLTGKVREVLET